MHSFTSTLVAAALAGVVSAGYDPNSKANIAPYWGQNSFGQGSGGLEQQSLATYCENANIDIIPMAFLYQFNGPGGQPVINFANIGDSCTVFEGTNLLHCPQVGQDIKRCQSLGKQIVLSIGGATYTEGGFSSSDAATAAANKVWAMFGPQQSGSNELRPFNDAAVDGFDFDFESTVQNIIPFGQRLRSVTDSDTSKKYYLTSAPQCPYPDAANQAVLDAVPFDIVWIQFYNNYCGLQSYVDGASEQFNFNYETWHNWAKNTSPNKSVKLMLGIPAGQTGAGSGYLALDRLTPVINFVKKFDTFAGVMMWDASQAYANNGFLDGVKSVLRSSTAKVARTFKA